MDLLRIIHRSHAVPQPHHRSRKRAASRTRLCRFEQIEARELLSVSVPALNVGATYYQPHDGNDSIGSLLYISWNGGAASTQLTDLYIDTHKVTGGTPQFTVTNPADGDVFFHIAPSSVAGTMQGVPPHGGRVVGNRTAGHYGQQRLHPVAHPIRQPRLPVERPAGAGSQRGHHAILVRRRRNAGCGRRRFRRHVFRGGLRRAPVSDHYGRRLLPQRVRQSGHHLRTEPAGRQLRQFVGDFHHQHAAGRPARAGVHRRGSRVDGADAPAHHALRHRLRGHERRQHSREPAIRASPASP